MDFQAPFSRSGKRNAPESADEGDSAELVIDAELAADDSAQQAPGTDAIPRRAAVPEAAEARAVAKRSDRDVAVRSVAVATAGGVVAGAATIAVAAVAKNLAKPMPGLSRRRRKDILQSQSFLIDVHMLKGSGRR